MTRFVIYTLLHLFLATKAPAQTSDSDLIFFTTHYKKGFYRNFDEFRRNAPSIPYEGEADNYKTVQLTFDATHPAPCAVGTPIWGFSDGNGIFISRARSFSETEVYYRIQYIGRFCYYETFWNPYYNMPHNKILEMGIDGNTGDGFLLTTKGVAEKLSRDEEIYNNFKKNPGKNHITVKVEYLKQYSKKHIEEIVR